ncbi:MAG: restriction endonuclease subunit S [Caulobacteraceae bacterium]|nr:restriction endonuclease subunit S [Caulobacteraceae bacterium]
MGDHADLMVGFPFKSGQFLETSDNAIRLLRGDNVGQGSLRWQGAKYWPETAADRFAVCQLEADDVILAMDRPWIEAGLKYAYVRLSDLPCLLVQRVARMRGTKTLDTKFLRHVIGSPPFTAHVMSITTGANIPHISARDIARFHFGLPPLDEQRRIASILGAYDELIEVNRRRIAGLEAMARGLFEEWFVRFRFPGYENHKFVETPDGRLPEGWCHQPVFDAFAFLGGGTPSKVEHAYWSDGSVNWFTPSDLTKSRTLFMDQSELRITTEAVRRSSARIFPPDSVMMTSRATLGVISINTSEATTNQGFITCIPNDIVPRTFLYYWLLRNVPVFVNHATGATFLEITKGVFGRLPFLTPPPEIVTRFERLARPMHDAILTLERSNRSLAASRDLLLPRLISGQLSVAAVGREVEAAA